MGKRHLIKTLYSKKSHYGFKTSNNYSGFCGEMGIAIIEYNTDKYPPVS